jgi:SAM-dependent methyltransferase
MGEPPGKVVDIGCQIGYFSFALAQRRFLVKGYDADAANIRIANMLKELSLFPNPTFECLKLSTETVRRIRPADHVLCMAVFHHIIYYDGLAAARQLIRALRNKTHKKLYFEIGQSNEPVEPWAEHLPHMGADPLGWITDFLRNGGYDEVKVLGLVPTHVSDVPRYLVAAS